MNLHRFLLPAALASLLALAACDPQRIAELEEGVSTEADVVARFGRPENVWPGPNGERIFEYNRQPEGTQNYMISIGPDGRMSALRQVLNPDNFRRVQPGMPMEAVRQMLGKPAKQIPYDLKREIYWSWRFMDADTQQKQMFHVVFNRDYRVLRTETGPDLDGPDMRGGG
ncbi:outer membrane protein assembly factor BamE [Comamonadaceae bacterium OH2545_COT-014]|nr:outer membrane protein assembly factor BamE [Comamonadaceae bacterium OH2545_COT-014]